MFKLLYTLLNFLKDEEGFSLGITRASLVSSVCDSTGEDSTDSVYKVRRLINRRGKQFCIIANWPFLRHDISFDITTSAYAYSGSGYLPTTFKKVVSAFLLDSTTRCPLNEVSIKEKGEWINPDDNTGRPYEFCITRMESGYWEMQFNKKPDNTYTVHFEIELQWADLTADDSETLITKEYEEAFTHYCTMGRLLQQGDTEQFLIYQSEWNNPDPKFGVLAGCLANLSSPLKRKSVKMDPDYALPHAEKSDYDAGEIHS